MHGRQKRSVIEPWARTTILDGQDSRIDSCRKGSFPLFLFAEYVYTSLNFFLQAEGSRPVADGVKKTCGDGNVWLAESNHCLHKAKLTNAPIQTTSIHRLVALRDESMSNLEAQTLLVWFILTPSFPVLNYLNKEKYRS